MSCSIELRNIKNIKSLKFDIPEKKGVYLLTGMNGCGKTSLLIALSRIKNKNDFRKYYVPTHTGIDDASSSEVIYMVNGEKVSYKHRNTKWAPTPRSNSNILANSGISNILFISTSGNRFYLPDRNQIPERLIYKKVSPTIIAKMNHILGTTKFNNLKFIQTNSRIGRRTRPNRCDKLYVIKGDKTFSEYSFSLGERLLLNILDFIDNIEGNSMLLIDEIELALHPLAQIRLVDYLETVAVEKSLTVIISTHSASLIRHSRNTIYMNNIDNNVEVLQNCKPAYILKDISAVEDEAPDHIFFVEDIMAKALLEHIILKTDYVRNSHRVTKVAEVGGYSSVIDLALQFYSISPFSKKNICVFLDNDVEDTLRSLKRKPEKSEAEELLLSRAKQLKDDNNLFFLNITPELGAWEWLNSSPEHYRRYITDMHGEQTFNLENIISETKENLSDLLREQPISRNAAKSLLKAFVERIQSRFPNRSITEVRLEIMRAYAEYCIQNHTLKLYYTQRIMPFLNRR